MAREKYNLFIYGSLLDKRIFKSVSGYGFTSKSSQAKKGTLLAQPAVLNGFRKVSTDNVYFYAVKSPASKIDGLVIYDLPKAAMDEIDGYEGKRYQRQLCRVSTEKGQVPAQAYLVSGEAMKKHFGDRWHVNLIHELWLRKRIEKFLKRKIRPGEKTTDAELERRAQRELLAVTERDLIITHYHSDAVSDYYLEHELDRPRPSVKYLYSDPQARPFISRYLAMVIKQVLLNQIDDKIQLRYRFELEHMRTSERYFKRTMSLLAALRMINSSSHSVNHIIQQGLKSLPFEKHDLIDYIKYAVGAAKDLFDSRIARAHLDNIRSNFKPGLVPLGAELEFSNLGPAAVEPQRSIKKKTDPVFNGFKYFYDFCLDILAWKLGGYIDDHSGSTGKGRCGFLELAPGRLNIEGELSRPATADPWTLNQLIHEIIKFFDVSPHSLHLSFQLRKKQVGQQQLLPLSFVKCLLAIGGGPELKKNGKLVISRMTCDEIKQYRDGEELVFARINKRQWFSGDDSIGEKAPAQAITCVQQYKFIRLEGQADYEPLIMCLKGLQLAFNPGDYLTAEQLKSSAELRDQYEQLQAWSDEPAQLSGKTINNFLDVVRDGLMNEGHHRPAHDFQYIESALAYIESQLRLFNNMVRQSKK